MSWIESEMPDAELIERRLMAAIRRRKGISAETNAYRLVHAESDGLPGLIIDRYGDGLVMQILTANLEPWRETISETASKLVQAEWLYERSIARVRELEALPQRSGALLGSPPSGAIEIRENGLSFLADIREGHKTGFYLDQRQNREHLRHRVAGHRVLNCFSYTGAFDVYALAGGADSVTSIETSSAARELAQKNLALNEFDSGLVTQSDEDVFKALRTLDKAGERYDTIILDPPKFAQTARQAQKAARGYKDINLNALRLLRPGGQLYTFSCSGGVDAALFQKIVAGAALDAGISAQITAQLHQGPDHPIALNFPEGAYLKGLLVQT
jgi:23S rRNA (cytosine1962-C5)-methyltransferase